MSLEDVEMLAFQMISYAGDAFDCYYHALCEYRMNHDKEKALERYNAGNEHLNKCHKVQTELIQKESRGEALPYSLIMTHAQDHFISAINWQRMAQLEIIDSK